MTSMQVGGPPSWWSASTNLADKALADLYAVPFISHIRYPAARALPAGYESYSAILHSLLFGSREQRWQTIDVGETYPWPQVETISSGKILASRLSDVPLTDDRRTACALADALDIADHNRYFVRVFASGYNVQSWDVEVSGDILHRWLTDENRSEWDSAGRLNIVFPSDRSWILSAPYDMAVSFLGASEAVAGKLALHPSIELVSCSVEVRDSL